MACSSCHQRKTLHQVRFADGTVRTFASERDARAKVSTTPGSEYQKVQR